MDLDVTAIRGFADLTVAVRQEARLLEVFRRAALQQREAVGLADAAGLESSLRLAGRALLTLREARRHRATVLQRLVGDPAQPLAELEARFDSPLPEPFLTARGEMRRVAIETAEAVWRNQELLLSALRERDALLQELLTGSRPTLPAGPASGATPAA